MALHARQQFKFVKGKQSRMFTQWILTFSRLLVGRLGQDPEDFLGPYRSTERRSYSGVERLSLRVQDLAKLLHCYPYSSQTQARINITPYSDNSIEPIHILCSSSNECETDSCSPRSLLLYTKPEDIGTVRLIKGTRTYSYAYPLSAQCTKCKTIYTADSEHSAQNNFECYLNSAKYLQLGSLLCSAKYFLYSAWCAWQALELGRQFLPQSMMRH